ncbi:MAG: family transcriptional regulator, regulator of embCAB operon [Pseudonocardiales bacterium]|nr:family transcriptional regulator, regulator of embCAB operon [Pseudonocardiales bacterium]
MTLEGTHVQLCGRFSVVLNGSQLDPALPGRRARHLVALLAVQRPYSVERDTLLDALWPDARRDSAAVALTVLLSKCRAVLGRDTLTGRGAIALSLPSGARVDVEQALAAAHDAESAVAQHQWARAWPAALTALFITRRRFLPDSDAAWTEEWRRRLELVHHRTLAYYAETCLGLGGTERGAAERAARRLIELAPLSETGYRLLMRAQADQGDVAAALLTCQHLRTVLREELGIAPGPMVQELLTRLLR